MEEIVGTYQEFKKTMDTELAKTAESFVKIGYLLKVARDTTVLQESGYTTVADFAKAEYGLSKDIVSRYIHINDRFSENGYSDTLARKYKGFGYSKLAEMLTLPDNIADALDPRMTRQQIQQVKEEVKQEEQITPLEVMAEEKDQGQQELKTDLQVFLHQYGYDHRENVLAIANAVADKNFIERILDILAPSGIAMLTVRIQGRGKLMLSIKGKDNKLELLDVRAGDKSEWEWEDLREDIQTVHRSGDKETWEIIYGEPFEKEETKAQESKVLKSVSKTTENVSKEPENVSKTEETEVVPAQQDKPKEEKQPVQKPEQTTCPPDQGSCPRASWGTNPEQQEAGKKECKSCWDEYKKQQKILEKSKKVENQEEIIKLKVPQEEQKNVIFEKWFDLVSREKIESAQERIEHMKFTERINVNPKQLGLLVQTEELVTEELKLDGELVVSASDGEYNVYFTMQEFQKRLKEVFDKKQEVTPVQTNHLEEYKKDFISSMKKIQEEFEKEEYRTVWKMTEELEAIIEDIVRETEEER